MNARIQRLREQSLQGLNNISAERALLVTRFYKSAHAYEVSVPVQRALCFEYILRNKTLCILPDELIVGERGPAPKATPTYPEVNLHSLKDLEILHERKKVHFQCDGETRKAFRDEIIPYWKEKTNRDKMMRLLPPDWHDAYRPAFLPNSWNSGRLATLFWVIKSIQKG
jgi:formate C-acetyltransferase